MHNLRIVLLILGALIAMSAPARAYSPSEILKIVMSGIRSHDPLVTKAVVVLRQARLLEATTTSLDEMGRRAQDPVVRQALDILHRRGFLPDASIGPKDLKEYLSQVAELDLEEQQLGREQELRRSQKVIMRMGIVTKATPFFVYVPGNKAFILGGMMPRGSTLEMSYAREDGYVEVVFPSVQRGYVHHDDMEPGGPVVSIYRQDPTQVRTLVNRGIKVVQALHLGARLSIIELPLAEGGPLTLRPVVTSKFDLRHPGTEAVAYVHDIAARSGALAAVNGTFFISSGKSGRGSPLAPLILDGEVAWSWNESRVLNMRRAYLAITTSNRVVVGDTDLTASNIATRHQDGSFDGDVFGDDEIRDLIGGFGWLVKDGDPKAWREYAGTQFGTSFYSHYVKRPQTVLGVSADGRRVWIVAQEGMPHSESPLPLPDLAEYLRVNYPIHNAVFMDGGGSTQMVVGSRNLTRQENNGPYRKNSTILAVSPNN